jgi:hypothetical protein
MFRSRFMQHHLAPCIFTPCVFFIEMPVLTGVIPRMPSRQRRSKIPPFNGKLRYNTNLELSSLSLEVLVAHPDIVEMDVFPEMTTLYVLPVCRPTPLFSSFHFCFVRTAVSVRIAHIFLWGNLGFYHLCVAVLWLY